MPQPSFLSASALVLIGGGFGSWLRFLIGRLWTAAIGPVAASDFPYSTLTVNVLGSLCMGLLTGWLARAGNPSEAPRLLLGMGLLGGFTTFSSFSLDFAVLIERGALGMAAFYVGLSLLAGFLSLFLGLSLMRSIAA